VGEELIVLSDELGNYRDDKTCCFDEGDRKLVKEGTSCFYSSIFLALFIKSSFVNGFVM